MTHTRTRKPRSRPHGQTPVTSGPPAQSPQGPVQGSPQGPLQPPVQGRPPTQSAEQASRPARRVLESVSSIAARAKVVDRAVAEALRPRTLPALRVLLGLLFVWFGGLKVVGRSPVADLVALTLPFADQRLVVPALGVAELALGILLMTGTLVRVALPALGMHLVGTFSTFVMVPGLMFTEGNPLLLTTIGEFVVKNVILVAATLVLITHPNQTARHRDLEPGTAGATGHSPFGATGALG